MANDIEILLLQPHTSHLLQPLDVAIFGPLSMALTRRLEPLNRQMRRRLEKNEWLEQYALARADAITPNNIASAWRGAGLFPFQPRKPIATCRPTAKHHQPTSKFLQQRHNRTISCFLPVLR